MNLRRYLSTLWRNAWIITTAAILGALVGLGLYSTLPKAYASAVTFYVSTPMPDGVNPMSAGEFAQDRVNSYLQLLKSERLATQVVTRTGVDLTPTEVAAKITPTAQAGTVLVTATVVDSSQDRAQLIARGLAGAFGPLVDQLDNQGRDKAVVVINTVSGPTELGQVAPSLVKLVGGGFAVGLLLGVLIAVARELLDVTVRTQDVAQAISQRSVIGAIEQDSTMRRAPLIVGEQGSGSRAEEFRQLRTNLQFMGVTRPADVMLVTSALPAEGKTSTAVNLAIAIAETGSRVLLIDADLRRPRIADLMNLDSTVGLTSALLGDTDAEAAVQRWGSEQLFVLCSGPVPPNPSELLASERMAEVMTALRGHYDTVILDAPPVLPVADAAVAAEHADGVVLVVRSGKTTQAQLSGAVRTLDSAGRSILGVVLNGRRVRRSERHKYGSDRYYVDHTASDQQRSRRPGVVEDAQNTPPGSKAISK